MNSTTCSRFECYMLQVRRSIWLVAQAMRRSWVMASVLKAQRGITIIKIENGLPCGRLILFFVADMFSSITV